MSVLERGADLQYRLFDAIRHRGAADLAAGPAQAGDFSGLRTARQCLVVTYKASGEPVPTPVNHGLDEDGRLYFRSEPRSGKVRRIRRNPQVLIAPCNIRGKPRGPAAAGLARVLGESESERAASAVASNWTAPMALLEHGLDRMPLEIVYVEVTPKPGGGA